MSEVITILSPALSLLALGLVALLFRKLHIKASDIEDLGKAAKDYASAMEVFLKLLEERKIHSELHSLGRDGRIAEAKEVVGQAKEKMENPKDIKGAVQNFRLLSQAAHELRRIYSCF
jgi:hypothetical protein